MTVASRVQARPRELNPPRTPPYDHALYDHSFVHEVPACQLGVDYSTYPTAPSPAPLLVHEYVLKGDPGLCRLPQVPRSVAPCHAARSPVPHSLASVDQPLPPFSSPPSRSPSHLQLPNPLSTKKPGSSSATDNFPPSPFTKVPFDLRDLRHALSFLVQSSFPPPSAFPRSERRPYIT